jgi:hypothetical protein
MRSLRKPYRLAGGGQTWIPARAAAPTHQNQPRITPITRIRDIRAISEIRG